MKRTLAFFILLIVLVSMLAACSGDTSVSAIYDLENEPVTLDPQSATDTQAFTVINNIFEGLVTIDENGQMVSGVAESYEVSPDGLTYTFLLKDGLTWSNGYSLTASDFVFAFRRLFDPATKSTTASSFYCIKNSYAVTNQGGSADSLGVVAESDLKLVIQLEYANTLFLQLLTTAPAMPCNEQFYIETEGAYGLEAKTLVSNGPYEVLRWYHDDYIKLSRNDVYYARSQVNLAGVTMWIGDDEEKRLNRFVAGKTDAYLYDGKSDSNIEGNNNFILNKKQDTVWGLVFNTTKQPLGNENFRRAIAYCFDRSGYEAVLPDYLTVAEGVIPPDVIVGDKKYRELVTGVTYPNFDVEQAKNFYHSALESVGVSQFTGLKVIVPKNSSVDNNKYFLYVSQILQKELNLFLAIEELSEADFKSKLSQGDYDLAIQKLDSSYNSPLSILNRFSSRSGDNYYSYQNGAYDTCLNQVLLEKDNASALKNCAQAEQILLDDAVIIPLYYQSDYLATGKSIGGIIRNTQNGMITFRYAYSK